MNNNDVKNTGKNNDINANNQDSTLSKDNDIDDGVIDKEDLKAMNDGTQVSMFSFTPIVRKKNKSKEKFELKDSVEIPKKEVSEVSKSSVKNINDVANGDSAKENNVVSESEDNSNVDSDSFGLNDKGDVSKDDFPGKDNSEVNAKIDNGNVDSDVNEDSDANEGSDDKGDINIKEDADGDKSLKIDEVNSAVGDKGDEEAKDNRKNVDVNDLQYSIDDLIKDDGESPKSGDSTSLDSSDNNLNVKAEDEGDNGDLSQSDVSLDGENVPGEDVPVKEKSLLDEIDTESTVFVISDEDRLKENTVVEEEKNEEVQTEEILEENGAEENSQEVVELPEAADKKRKKKIKKEKVQEPLHTRKIDTVFDFLELFVFTLAIVLIFTTFFFQFSVVEGDSMMNTLHDGDQLILRSIGYTPKNGDIVVCEDYTTPLKKPIVKRVIATEGQTVRVTRDAIFVDGEKLDEPYVYTNGLDYKYEIFPRGANRQNPTLKIVFGEYYELTVPEDEIFVMGDHRNMSTDSREIGPVRVDAVLGKVVLRLYPFSVAGRVK